jgi:hypothetical protein
MKKALSIIFLTIFIFLNAAPVYAGLVPCGLSQDDPTQPGDQTVPCQFCHIFVLFKNVIDFALRYIVPSLAVLMLAIAGFMYMFAYFNLGQALPGGDKGGPALLGQAKKIITSVVFGLLIIFAAWVIVNTFFQIIGVSTWEGWSLKQGWWQINCP